MYKKKQFFAVCTLILALLAVVTGYLWKSQKTNKIQQINRTLARNITTKALPASAGASSVGEISVKSAMDQPRATLTEEKLDPLRRDFSRSKSSAPIHSQPKEKTIILANRTISVPENAELPTTFSNNQIPTTRSTLPYIIHFGKPVTAEMRQGVESSGAILRGYLPNYAFLAELTIDSLRLITDDPNINYVTEYTVEDKIQPFLATLVKTENAADTIQVSIQTLDSKDVVHVEAYLKQRGASIESINRLSAWGVVNATMALRDIAALATLGEVQWIEELVEAKLLNDSAAGTEHLNAGSMWNEWYLTGKGQVIGHADTGIDSGDEATIHADFKGQIKVFYDLANGGADAADYDGHGTHTAGSICGNGASSGGQYKGIAHGSQLVAQCVADKNTGSLTGLSNLFNLYQQSYDAGACIHSDSWGADSYGEYDNMSRVTDLFTWTNTDFLPVFAAGNSGRDINNNGVVDLDSIGSPATAKNVLTVGATESDRPFAMEGYRASKYSNKWSGTYKTNPIKDDYISWSATTSPYLQGMAAFSSRGPTDDSRIKPELCTPGTDIISTRSFATGAGYGWGILPSNNKYCYNGGTSMSTPLAAGNLALIRQYMVERAGIAQPSAALLKAAIVGGSRTLAPGQYGTGPKQEIPYSSPNNVEGWGQPDLEQTVHPAGLMIKLIDNISPKTGATNIFEITVEKSGYPLDIVLSWIDYPATAGASVTLINDLNLNVITPGTNTIFPNNGTANDDRNTVESVAISSATSGVYTIMVIGDNVPQSNGTAALYIRGAINEKPIIVHRAVSNYDANLAPYPIDFKVQSLNTLTNNELEVYYNTGTANSITGIWHNTTAHWTSNANYRAFIPQMPQNITLHYYINFSNELFTVDSPQSAVVSNSYFTMHLGTQVTLTVAGDPDKYGTVAPDYGTNTLLSGQVFFASAYPETVSALEQLAAYNWSGTGDIPASGSANPLMHSIMQKSTLTWNWKTQYLLTRKMYFKNLGVTIDDSIDWHWKDMTVPDQATPDLLNVITDDDEFLYAFYGWSINGARWPDATSPSINPLSGLVMTFANTLQANYMEFGTDDDGDDLYDWWEMTYFGDITTTDSTSDDSDGDLWTNLAESLDNTNPLDPDSFPTPPVITITPLNPFQSARPPWTVFAEVTDNFIIMDVTLEWREKGDSAWQQIEMEYQGDNVFAGVLTPASDGSKRVDYRVTAYDLVGYYDSSFATVSPTYSVIGDYDSPWMEVSPLSFGMAELSVQPTNCSVTVANLAGPNLVWTAFTATVSHNFDTLNPAWQHSGTNDGWTISTHRTWNGGPVWYCGNDLSHSYPNLCHASLDTPSFMVGNNGVLIFRHWMDFENYGPDKPDYYWDGAILMISTNNGASFIKITPVEGYNGLIESNPDSPFPADTACLGDTGSGWQTTMVDLAQYAGETAMIRFEFGSDRYTTEEGWYIGGVTALSSNAPMPPWLTLSGDWNGILPDTWSDEFGFSVDPLQMATNSEHVFCIRFNSNDHESRQIIDFTARRGFTVTAQTSGFGEIFINEPFIFRDASAVIDIQADYGSYITNVMINGVFQLGDYDYTDTNRNYTLHPVTSNMHVVADFALRSWELTINSAYGSPSPAVGNHSLAHGSEITAQVTTPVYDSNPMIRYTADGHILGGVEPLFMESDAITFILTNNVELTWQWTTNYQLTAISTGNGVVVPPAAWHSAGSTGCTTGYPASYYHFDQWSGATNNGAVNGSVILLPMGAPRTVYAAFTPNLTHTHGVPEYWLAAYGITSDFENAAESDLDGDTMETWREWRSDTNPTNKNSLLQVTAIRIDGNQVDVEWIGGTMRTQLLQSALSPAGPWTELQLYEPPTTITNSRMWSYTEIPTNLFFRVVVP